MISFLKEVVRQHYLILLIAIFSALFWPQIKQHYYGYIISENVESALKTDNVDKNADTNTLANTVRLFTQNELSKYNGEEDSEDLYLSIMGSVYDVQKGIKFYGVDGGYHFFAGRDASTAFISGDFVTLNDDVDDILTLKPREILSLKQWKEFYDKDYTFKGKLIGRFYDEQGHETEYMGKVYEQIEVAIENKRKEEMKSFEFPPCNIEWNADTGTKVWCTVQSGGVEREWTGVPRKYFEAGSTHYRCACVHENKLGDGTLKEYDDCDPNSTTCFYNPDA